MLKTIVALAGVAAIAVPAPQALRAVARSCGTVSDYGPTWSPNGRALAFTRVHGSGGLSDVYVIGADGRRQRRVNAPFDYAYGGVWSPDGKQIAYSTFDVAAVVRIVVAQTNGTGTHVLASFQGEREPPPTYLAWSRDGRRVAYVDSGGSLIAADAEGRTAPQLLARGATQPAWAPDGRHLAYVGPIGITVADADGGNPRVLVTGAYPVWSPDSHRIAFTSTSGAGVHIVDADGSNDRVVDPRGGFPGWLATGRALVDTTSSERVHGTVRVVDLRSGRIRTVTHDASRAFGSDDSQAGFSPTSPLIAFASLPSSGKSEIRLVRSDGRAERRLTYHCVVPDESTGGRISGTWLDDLVLARNHLRDTILCGRGRDVVYADRHDRLYDCEVVRRG